MAFVAEFVGTLEIVREIISSPLSFQLQIEAILWYTIGSISMKEVVPEYIRKKHPGAVEDQIRLNGIIARQEIRSSPSTHYRSKWEIHKGDLADYSRTFADLLGGVDLSTLLRTVLERNPDAAIADFMTTDNALKEAVDLGFGYALAVSLGFPRLHDGYRDRIDIINGDILSADTWEDIELALMSVGKTHFDVMLARPQGGVSHLTPFPVVHLNLLQNMWQMLTPDYGQLIVQAPFGTHAKGWRYLEKLQELYPDNVRFGTSEATRQHGYPVYLLKTDKMPVELPTLKMLGMKKNYGK